MVNKIINHDHPLLDSRARAPRKIPPYNSQQLLVLVVASSGSRTHHNNNDQHCQCHHHQVLMIGMRSLLLI
jgi:hypothetical protein